MVKAAGFVPRIVQLWVRNITALANSYRETQSHIHFNLNYARWSPYRKI